MKPIEFRGKETMSYNKTEQPTAEEAEEILRKIVGIEKSGFKRDFAWFSEAIAAMHEFATLHTQRIADKIVEEKLIEFGNMIRDEPNGDIPALAEYFMRTIDLKSRE